MALLVGAAVSPVFRKATLLPTVLLSGRKALMSGMNCMVSRKTSEENGKKRGTYKTTDRSPNIIMPGRKCE